VADAGLLPVGRLQRTVSDRFDEARDRGDTDATLDPEDLDAALAETFDSTAAERRVVVRQARDLADSGKVTRDRGTPLTVAEVLDNLADAPAGDSLASRWNWWLGALEVAYGGYAEFQVRAVEKS
jgi:hypothetical protein